MLADDRRWGEPVWVDWANECVWRRGEAVRLTPKGFAVLRTLTEQAGQLVTKEALLQAVWPEAVVSEAVLTVCIGELRKALGETARAPRCIQTVHRRGYRFMGSVQSLEPSGRGSQLVAGKPPEAAQPTTLPPVSQASSGASPRAAAIVGRAAELAQLHQWLEQARYGLRQVVFVTGELGMGKTTVVHAFVEQAAAEGGVWIAQGQCLEHHGAGEAYLPVLEALGRLCRAPAGEQLLAVLEQEAPTWLVQMPALCSAAVFEDVQRKVLGATQERMLREMADAIETFTMDHPLVLVLEDLHWSDSATVDRWCTRYQRIIPV